MVWRRRGHGPLQAVRPFPDLSRGLLAATHSLHNDVKERQLCQAQAECANARPHVEFAELQRIVGDAAWHPRQSQEVLWEERDVENIAVNQKCHLPMVSLYI